MKKALRNLFLSYELSSLVKELGFNEPCLARYVGPNHFCSPDCTDEDEVKLNSKQSKYVILAPTHQQLINWLRENHGIKINPTEFFKNIHSFEIRKVGTKEGRKLIRICDEGLSYQEAQNKAIEEALNLIKDVIDTKVSSIKKLELKKLGSSIPVTNNAKILSFIVNIQQRAYENNTKSLSVNLTSELTKLYGKHNSVFTSEYRHKIWTLQYGELVFNVFTAKGKGTVIEICNCDWDKIREKETENLIMLFLESLNSEINNLV